MLKLLANCLSILLLRECLRITVYVADQHLALFNASFETNPLDGKCDQRAVVSSQPVKVIYDAVSSHYEQVS